MQLIRINYSQDGKMEQLKDIEDIKKYQVMSGKFKRIREKRAAF